MIIRIKQSILMLVLVASLGFFGPVNGMDCVQRDPVMEFLMQDKQKKKQERAETRTIIELDAKKRFLCSTGVISLGNTEETRKKKIFGIIALSYGTRFSDQLRQAFKYVLENSSMVKIRNSNDRFFDYVCEVYYIPGQQKTRWMLKLSRSLRIERAEDGTGLK